MYRVFITLTIAWFIGQQYFFVGVLLAAWSLGMGLVWPLLKGYGKLLVDPQAASRAARVLAVAGGGPLLLALLLFVLPMPHHTRTQGVVALPEQAVLRAGANGFIDAVLLAPDAPVNPGDVVLRTSSPILRTEYRAQRAVVEEVQARLDAEWGVNPAAAGQIAEELRREQAVLQRLADELGRMEVKAAVPGRLLLDQPADLPGRHVRQGDALAYVVGAVTPIVRVVVPQGEADRVRLDTRSVDVRLPQHFAQALPARLVRAVPGASPQLPSATLGPQGGGPFTVDPRDEQGRTALEAVFEFELELPGQQAERHLGSRAYVAFQHPPEPLGWRWLRALRRQFLSQFEI